MTVLLLAASDSVAREPKPWDPIPDEPGRFIGKEPHGTYCSQMFIGVARLEFRLHVDKQERVFKFRVGGWPDFPMCRDNAYTFERVGRYSGELAPWRPYGCLQSALKRLGLTGDDVYATWWGTNETVSVVVEEATFPMLGLDQDDITVTMRKRWCPVESPIMTNVHGHTIPAEM